MSSSSDDSSSDTSSSDASSSDQSSANSSSSASSSSSTSSDSNSSSSASGSSGSSSSAHTPAVSLATTKPAKKGIVSKFKAQAKLFKDRMTPVKMNGVFVVTDPIQFELNTAKLRPESKTPLEAAANILKQRREAKLILEGHTSPSASGTPTNRAYLRNLSRRRAKACKAYIVSKGVRGNRIKATGYGDRRPLPHSTVASRRVDFIWVGDDELEEAQRKADALRYAAMGPAVALSSDSDDTDASTDSSSSDDESSDDDSSADSDESETEA